MGLQGCDRDVTRATAGISWRIEGTALDTSDLSIEAYDIAHSTVSSTLTVASHPGRVKWLAIVEACAAVLTVRAAPIELTINLRD